MQDRFFQLILIQLLLLEAKNAQYESTSLNECLLIKMSQRD